VALMSYTRPLTPRSNLLESDQHPLFLLGERGEKTLCLASLWMKARLDRET
jgi:hypothetical protein